MAKKLLLDSLTKALGGIVEGINEENLKLGIWSGKVVLKNVALNIDALKEKDLPINIYSGSIESLELFIPWSSLASEPVKVKINGVYLLAGPYNKKQLNQLSCQERLYDKKKSILNKNDIEHLAGLIKNDNDKNTNEQEKNTEKDKGWAASLIMKIVDNIQITIESLHIRYEQKDAFGKIFACGITIDSFIIRSTDSKYNEIDFVIRNKTETKLYKKATLFKLSIYLDDSAEDLCLQAQEYGGNSIREKMSKLIARNDQISASTSSSTSNHQTGLPEECYILSPMSIQVCGIRNEKPSKTLYGENPAIILSLKLLDRKGYEITLRQKVYHKLLLILQSFNDLNERVYILGHPSRPIVPILKKENGNPTLWFQFITNLIISSSSSSSSQNNQQNNNNDVSKIIKFKLLCLKSNPHMKRQPTTIEIKKLYINLIKRLSNKIIRFPNLKLKPLSDNIAVSNNKDMNNDNGNNNDLYSQHQWLIDYNENKTLKLLEQCLPLEILIKLRHEGNIQLELLDRKYIEKQQKNGKTQKKWWQFGSGSGGDNGADDAQGNNDVSIEEIVRTQGAKASELIASGQTLNTVPIPSIKCYVQTFGVFKVYQENGYSSSINTNKLNNIDDKGLLLTATSTFNCEMGIDMTNNSYDALVQLADLEITDHVTVKANFPKVITTKVESIESQAVNWTSINPCTLPSSPSSSSTTAISASSNDDDKEDDNMLLFGHIQMPLDSNSDIVLGIQDQKDEQVGGGKHKRDKGLFIKMRSKSFIFSFNEPFVKALSDYFKPPSNLSSPSSIPHNDHNDDVNDFKMDLGNEISHLTNNKLEQVTQFTKTKLAQMDLRNKVENDNDDDEGKNTASSNGGLTLDMVAGAPKIVLLVHPSDERGFLLLDCGTLSIMGTFGGDNVGSPIAGGGGSSNPVMLNDVILSEWKVLLSSINAKMQSTKIDLFNMKSTKGNILKKFDVDVHVLLRASPPPLPPSFQQHSRLSSSSLSSLPDYTCIPELEVSCHLNQPISGHLSPNVLNDLLYILMNLGKNVNHQEDNNIIQDKQIIHQPNASLSLHPHNDNVSVSNNDNDISNPYAVALKANVSIKQVQLTLTNENDESELESEPESELLTLSLNEVKVNLLNRSEDSFIQIHLGSVSLSDLCLDLNHVEGVENPQQLRNNVIISSHVHHKHDHQSGNTTTTIGGSLSHMIQIDFLAINSKKSPYLIHEQNDQNDKKTLSNYFIGKKIMIKFGSLNAVLLKSSIIRLKPFYDILLKAGQLSSQDKLNIDIVNKNEIEQQNALLKVIQSGGGKTEIELYINEISAEIAIETSMNQSSISTSHFHHNKNNKLNYMIKPIIRSSINGLECQVIITPSNMDVHLVLKSFSVIDCREEAKLYHYKHLIAPSSSFLSQTATTITTLNHKNEKDDEEDKEEEMKPLLNLTFAVDKISNISLVDITLNEFHSFFIVPSMVATLDAILDLKGGIDYLISDINQNGNNKIKQININHQDGKDEEATSINVSEIDQPSPSSALPLIIKKNMNLYGSDVTLMKVNIILLDLSLIIMESPQNEQTSGVVLHAKSIINYSTEIESNIKNQNTDTIMTRNKLNVSIENLEAYIDVNMSQSSKLHVLDPTMISFNYNTEAKNNFIFLTYSELEFEDAINLRISFQDVLLALNTMNALQNSVNALSASSNVNVSNESEEDEDDDTNTNDNNIKKVSTKLSNHHQNETKEFMEQVSTLSFKAKLKSIQLEFIDDSQNKTLPLIRIDLFNFDINFQGNLIPKNIIGSIGYDIKSDVFNQTLGIWEEFIEKWPIVFLINMNESLNTYEFSTNKILNITLSNSMLLNVLNIISMLKDLTNKNIESDKDINNDDENENLIKAESRIAPPYKFLNKTGCVTKLYHNKENKNSYITQVEPGEYKSFNIESSSTFSKTKEDINNAVQIAASKRRALSELAIGQETSTSTISICIENDKIGQRMPIDGIITNVVNSSRHVLLPSTSTSTSSSPAPFVKRSVTETIWQYQRRNEVTRSWNPPFMYGDPYEWSNASRSKEVLKESILLPQDMTNSSSSRWIWYNDWSVHPIDASLNLNEGYEIQVDDEGWEYGTSFENMNRGRWNDRSIRRDVDTVRRRRWTRVRGMIPSSSSSSSSSHSIKERSLVVSIETLKDPSNNGGLMIRASSGIRIENHSGLRLEYGAKSEGCWKDIIPFGTTQGNGDAIFLPLDLCEATDILLREVSSSSSHQLPPPWLLEHKIPLVALESTFAISRKDPKLVSISSSSPSSQQHPSIAFHYKYDGFDTNSCLTIELHPTLVIMNKLPCCLEYAISNSSKPFNSYPKSNEGLKSPQMIYGSDVSKQSSIPIFNDNTLLLYIKINGSNWSESIPFGTSSILSLISKQSNSNSTSSKKSSSENSINLSKLEPILIPIEWPIEPSIGQGGGQSLTLLLNVSSPNPGRIIIEIYSKFWISDRTGLGFTFGSKGALTRYKPKLSGSMPTYETPQTQAREQNGRKRNEETLEVSNNININPSQYQASLSSWTKEEIEMNNTILRSERCEDWALNKNGLGLLYSSKDHIVLALKNNTSFAHPSMSLNEIDQLKHDYQISQVLSTFSDSSMADNIFSFTCGERILELCMSVQTLPSPFSCSKLVIFKNKYVIINIFENSTLLIRQEDTPEHDNHIIEIPPKGKSLLHWSSNKAPKRLLFKLKNETDWSYGGLSVDAIGGNAIWLPPPTSTSTSSPRIINALEFQTIQIEVQLSDQNKDSCMSIVVWKANSLSSDRQSIDSLKKDNMNDSSSSSSSSLLSLHPLLSCKNTSAHTIELRQAYKNSTILTNKKKQILNYIQWQLKPQEEMIFGWLVPTDPQIVYVSLLEDNVSETRFNSLSSSLSSSRHEVEDSLNTSKHDVNKDENDMIDNEEWVNDDHEEEVDEKLSKRSSDQNNIVSKSKNLFQQRRIDHPFDLKSLSKGKISVLRKSNQKKALAMAVIAIGGTKQLLAASGGKALAKLQKLGNSNVDEKIASSIATSTTSTSSTSTSLMNSKILNIIQLTKISFHMKPGLGVSMIDDNGDGVGIRREILYAFCSGISFSQATTTIYHHHYHGTNNQQIKKIKSINNEMEIAIDHLQIDNHIRHAPYDVLLVGKSNKNDKNKNKNKEENKEHEPFFKSSIIHYGTDSIPYIAVRLLPISIEIDLGTVLKLSNYFTPLFLHNMNHINNLAKSHSKKFIHNYTYELIEKPFENEDIESILIQLQQSRIHYQYLSIHPMIMYLTFADAADMRLENNSTTTMQQQDGESGGNRGGVGGGEGQSMILFGTGNANNYFFDIYHHDKNENEINERTFQLLCEETYHQNGNGGSGLDGTLAQVLLNMASVSRAPMKLKGFIVEDAIESTSTMVLLLQRHYIRGILSQIMALAGSMAAIGNPVDLASNIGGGVKSLFYEPLQGLVLGPKEFVKGIGRGGKGFIDGMVHGVTSSVAGVGDTVNKNLTMLTFDEDYTAERRRVRQIQQEKSIQNDDGSGGGGGGSGVGQGLMNAGQNVFGGLSSGIGGLVTAPIKGAKKEGVGGFFKGVGKGLVGAVVKPVVGVTEGVTAVVQSVSNSTDTSLYSKILQIRKRRTIPLLYGVGFRMVLLPYDLNASLAQYYAFHEKDDDLNMSAKQIKKSKMKLPNIFMGYANLLHQFDRNLKLTIIVTTKRLIIRVEPITTSTKSSSSGRAEEENLSSSSSSIQKPKQVSILWSDISKCIPSDNGIIIHFYNSMAQIMKTLSVSSDKNISNNEFSLYCPIQNQRKELYHLLLRRKELMGDPASMPHSIDGPNNDHANNGGGGGGNDKGIGSLHMISNVTSKLKKGLNTAAPSSSLVTNEKPYIFGSVNKSIPLGLLNNNEINYEESDIFNMCKESYHKMKKDNELRNRQTLTNYQKSVIDSTAWNVIRIWLGTHKLINFKKICVVVLINESNSPIQISEPFVHAGQATQMIYDKETYDQTSKMLLPLGVIYVVGWSYGPNPFKKQHILFAIDTTATQIMCSDMRSKITSIAKTGYHSGLLESSIAENKDWSKIIVAVTSR